MYQVPCSCSPVIVFSHQAILCDGDCHVCILSLRKLKHRAVKCLYRITHPVTSELVYESTSDSKAHVFIHYSSRLLEPVCHSLLGQCPPLSPHTLGLTFLTLSLGHNFFTCWPSLCLTHIFCTQEPCSKLQEERKRD